jgi:hypothetical protein
MRRHPPILHRPSFPIVEVDGGKVVGKHIEEMAAMMINQSIERMFYFQAHYM